MLKVLAVIITTSVTKPFSRLFSEVRPRVQILHSSGAFSKLRKEGTLPVSVKVLSYRVFEYCGTCSCKKKRQIEN